MSVAWCAYNSQGRITRYGSSPWMQGALLQARTGEAVLVLASGTPVDDETHYVDLSGQEPVLAPRPELAFDTLEIAADGEEVATLAGLPDPCTVLIDGEQEEIAGGVLEIDATLPASYRVQIPDPFPAQPLDVEIQAYEPAEPE